MSVALHLVARGGGRRAKYLSSETWKERWEHLRGNYEEQHFGGFSPKEVQSSRVRSWETVVGPCGASRRRGVRHCRSRQEHCPLAQAQTLVDDAGIHLNLQKLNFSLLNSG